MLKLGAIVMGLPDSRIDEMLTLVGLGEVEAKRLLRGFAERGGTVLLSSHLIHEIEVIADELVVIGRGKIVAQGSKKSMLTDAGTMVRSLDDDALAAALTDAGLTFSASN